MGVWLIGSILKNSVRSWGLRLPVYSENMKSSWKRKKHASLNLPTKLKAGSEKIWRQRGAFTNKRRLTLLTPASVNFCESIRWNQFPAAMFGANRTDSIRIAKYFRRAFEQEELEQTGRKE